MTATLLVFLALASYVPTIDIDRTCRGAESAAGGSGRRLSEMRSGRADGARGAFKDLEPNSDRLTAAVHGSVDGFFPKLCRIADLSGDASCCRMRAFDTQTQATEVSRHPRLRAPATGAPPVSAASSWTF